MTTLMKILRWAVALPLIAAAVLFALAHPQPVAFYWSPVNDPLTVPLYTLALGLCALGFIIGALAAWFGMGKVRHDRREQKKTIRQLEKDLAAANETIIKVREETLALTALPRPNNGTTPHV